MTTTTQDPNYYVFVILSLDHPIYRRIQEKRRQLLEKYEIPYTVLINQQDTSVHDHSVTPTLTPFSYDEVNFPSSDQNPSMTLKFLNATKLYFRSFRRWEEVPTYIVRINATVFVDWVSLQNEILPHLPKEGVLAGPCYTPNCEPFMNGMLMIFSKDVLYHILHDPAIFDKKFMSENDDVVLTCLARKYAPHMINLMNHFVYPEYGDTIHDNGAYRLDNIQPKQNRKYFFRIAHYENRDMDDHNWDALLHHFYDISLSTTENRMVQTSSSSSTYFWIILVGVILLIAFIVVWGWRRK